MDTMHDETAQELEEAEYAFRDAAHAGADGEELLRAARILAEAIRLESSAYWEADRITCARESKVRAWSP